MTPLAHQAFIKLQKKQLSIRLLLGWRRTFLACECILWHQFDKGDVMWSLIIRTNLLDCSAPLAVFPIKHLLLDAVVVKCP